MVVQNSHTSSENSARRPTNSLIQPPPTPEQHADQHAGENTVKHWVSLEGGDIDPLAVPEEMMRKGYVMQWKAKSVMGNTDMQRKHMMDLYRAGWRAVAGERGKGYFFMPEEQIPATIEIGGSILMEREQYIEDHARNLAQTAAKSQLNDKLESIGHAGTKLGPVQHGISRTVEQGMQVADE